MYQQQHQSQAGRGGPPQGGGRGGPPQGGGRGGPQQGGAPPGQGQPQQAWYQGYAQNMNPQLRQQLQQWFASVDRDRSGNISTQELHQALSMGGHGFSMEVTHKLVQAFDMDGNGEIGLDEFIAMHQFLEAMKNSFNYFDQDRSGNLDIGELLQALNRAGYPISQYALYAFLPRFDRQRIGRLQFDAYLDLCIWLGNLKKLFGFYDPQGRGQITLNFDQLTACAPYFM